MATNVSSEVKLTVTLLFNASFSWLEKPSDTVLTAKLATCVCLSLLAVAAMLLNACVMLAVCCSSSLKKLTLNQLVAQMSLTCFLDCSINVPFSMYFIKTHVWHHGTVFCTLNAASMIFFTLLIAWILCYLCLERYFSLVKLCRIARCSLFCKQRVAMGTMLVFASGVIFPVASRMVEVRAFPSRYSCYVATDKEESYRIIIIVIFCVPVIIAMTTLICAYVKNFQGIKDINSQRTELSYTELFFEESHLWNEWQTSKFVGAVMMMFIFFELPAIVTFMKPTHVSLKSPTELNSTNNSSLQVSYPVAQLTSSVEKAYFWCRFVFCLAFPLNTLILRKDIRKKVAILFSYCRASSFPKSTVESPTSPEESPDDFLVPQMWRRRRLSSVTSLKAPIIFGKARAGSLQFMDLTTGIARWKAKYDEPKCNQVDRPFFADIFDDEEELAEFVSFQDFTEEELDSSQVPSVSTSSKDVAVQTAITEPFHKEPNCNITVQKPKKRAWDDQAERCRKHRNCRLTKSFSCSHGNDVRVNYKYYMTFPKMASSSVRKDSKDTCTSSELLRALQIKRSRRNNMPVCDLIPRGTEELLESPVESRDIVSL